MQDFVFHVPGRVVLGTDTLARLGSIAAEYGTRALIVTDGILRESGQSERIKQYLESSGITTIVFDEFDSGSDSAVIERALGLARASHSQLVIGVGGMRVLAAARVVAAYAPHTREFREVFALGTRVKPLGYLEVPTNGRNHVLLRDQCVVTQSGTRQPVSVKLPAGMMKAAILDAKLAGAVATKSYCALLLDTILAAVEGILSTRSSELSDTLLLQAIVLLRESVEQVVAQPGDLRPRARATEAAFMCALGLSISSQGIGGAVSYALNSRFDVPKSWTSTALLPYLLDYFEGTRPDKLRKIASALGDHEHEDSSSRAMHRAGSSARRLLARTGLPARLRELDLSLNDLSAAADSASDFDMISFVPVPVSTQELYDILKQAY